MSPIIYLMFLVIIASSGSPIHAVQYQVTNRATGTPGGTRFENEIGIPFTQQTIQLASQFILQTFKQIDQFGGKNIEHVSVIVTALNGNSAAITSGNNIFLDSNYIEGFSGDVRNEVIGILYHEATHIWQWFGNKEAPRGLTEGVADFMRLKAGFAPPHWVPRGTGSGWDEGYVVTAYFLDYCNGLRDGFVAELNAMMKDHYSDDFFVKLLGKSVDQLWSDYKSVFGN